MVTGMVPSGIEALAGDDADALEDAEIAEPPLGAGRHVRGIEVAGVDAGAALDEPRLDGIGSDDLDPAEIGRRAGHDVERDVEDAAGVVGDDVVLGDHGERMAELSPAIGDRRLGGDDRIRVGETRPVMRPVSRSVSPGGRGDASTVPKVKGSPGVTTTRTGTGRAETCRTD